MPFQHGGLLSQAILVTTQDATVGTESGAMVRTDPVGLLDVSIERSPQPTNVPGDLHQQSDDRDEQRREGVAWYPAVELPVATHEPLEYYET